MSSFSPTNPEALRQALDGLKRRNAGKRLTNYFLNPLEDVNNLRALESEKSFCFTHDEWDFARVYFYTYDISDLQQILGTVAWPPIAVADWIAKDGPGALDSLFTALGFHLHAAYDRIICRQFRSENTNSDLCFAAEADRDAIHSALFRIYDKYADHILSARELGQLIEQKQVLISRDAEGAINGFVAFPINNQTCNFNLLYNSGGPANLSGLLENFYGTLAVRGVQSGFSWVRRTRPLVLRLHQSFGWKTDGLVDYIYLR
jgi:hypothetical protein